MTARRLIAADVGGTHARLALIDGAAGERRAGTLRGATRAPTFRGLAALLRRYIDGLDIAGLDGAAPVDAAVAIAGVLDGDRLINTNLPRPVSSSQTRRDAGLFQLHLINDFEALAYAAPAIDDVDTRLCAARRVRRSPAPSC